MAVVRWWAAQGATLSRYNVGAAAFSLVYLCPKTEESSATEDWALDRQSWYRGRRCPAPTLSAAAGVTAAGHDRPALQNAVMQPPTTSTNSNQSGAAACAGITCRPRNGAPQWTAKLNDLPPFRSGVLTTGECNSQAVLYRERKEWLRRILR
jgi:hypothetical protein